MLGRGSAIAALDWARTEHEISKSQSLKSTVEDVPFLGDFRDNLRNKWLASGGKNSRILGFRGEILT